MKFTAFLIGVSTANASVLEAFFGLNRNLADMCLTETTDLFVDGGEMAQSFEAVEDEIEDKADCWEPGNSVTYCNVDFDTFDSADDFESTCSSMGGKTVKVTAEIQCRYNSVTSPTQRQSNEGFTLTYQNLLDCVSDSCAADEVTSKVSETVVNTAVEVGDQVNAECSSTIKDFTLIGSDDEGGADTEGNADTEGDADEEDEETSIEEDAEIIKSSGQCRTLMTATAAIGAMIPLAI